VKKSICIFVILLIIEICVAGCSAPSKDESKDLLLLYLKDTYRWLEKEDIEIVKTYSKDSNTVIVMQVGEALCDVTAIKVKNKWVGRQLTCSGTITAPKTAKERIRARNIAAIKKDMETMNKKCPIVENETRIDKVDFNEQTNIMVYYMTLPTVAHADSKMQEEYKTAFHNIFRENYCSDPDIQFLFKLGVSILYNIKANDGGFLAEVPFSKAVCDNTTSGNH